MLLVIGSAVAVSSQTPEWIVYNTDNSGLPSNDLTPALAIDKQGNKWIGTLRAGLAKFDQETWTVYNAGNSGLPGNGLRKGLAIDKQGNIWIGTERGLAKFDGEAWTVYNTRNSGLPDNWVWSLAIDEQGNKWIGTESGGLAVYRESGVILTGVQE